MPRAAELIIRPAAAADLPAVRAMWNAMIRETTATFTTLEKTRGDLSALLAARTGAFWVAEQGGEIAGFVTWSAFRDGPGYAHTAEHTIITAQPGQGVGTALLTAAEQHAAAQGLHVLVAAISGENDPAVAFHARHGFDVSGRLPEVGHKAGRWLDLILMTKTLDLP